MKQTELNFAQQNKLESFSRSLIRKTKQKIQKLVWIMISGVLCRDKKFFPKPLSVFLDEYDTKKFF